MDRAYRYRRYDDYPAIEVGRVDNIPEEFCGLMGVPITFLGTFNYGPDRDYELVGTSGQGDIPNTLRIDGVNKYKRILIRRHRDCWLNDYDPNLSRIDLIDGATLSEWYERLAQ